MLFHPSQKKISKFIDNQLSEKEKEAMEEHLMKCKKCSDSVSLSDNMDSSFRPKEELSEDFSKSIMSGLRDIDRIEAESCAVVSSVIGPVTIKNENSKFRTELLPNMALKKGDTIYTDEGSKALIIMNDSSEIYINDNTELKMEEKKHAVSLSLGQLFINMKKQIEKFMIFTPDAELKVIGTSFETTVTEENGTILSVLRGMVSYKHKSGEVRVGKNRKVDPAGTMNLQVSRINNSKSVGRWTAEIDKSGGAGKKPGKNRGIKTFLFLMAVIGAFFLFQFFNNPGGSVSSLTGNEEIQLVSPFDNPGASWRCKVLREGKRDGKWTYIEDFTFKNEVLETDPVKGTRLRYILEEFNIPRDHKDWDFVKSVEGMQFEYFQSPDGDIDFIGKSKDVPLKEMEIVIFIRTFITNMHLPYYRNEKMKPGDEWAYTLKLSIPENPQSWIESTVIISYSGFKMYKGREYALLKADYEGNLGGGLVLKVEKDYPGAERTIMIDRTEFWGKTDYYFNKTFGALEKCVDIGYDGDTEYTVSYKAPDGRTWEETINKDSDRSQSENRPVRRTIDIEYITPVLTIL